MELNRFDFDKNNMTSLSLPSPIDYHDICQNFKQVCREFSKYSACGKKN